MASRHAHIGLHITVLWPVLLGVLGVLLYGAVYGGSAPSLAGDRPSAEVCLGERIAVEAWPARSPQARSGPAAIPDVPSPVAADL